MKKKSIFRKKSRINYTQIPNYILNNKSLSWGAKGLLCYLLSKPDDWQVYEGEIGTHTRDGRRLTHRYFGELLDRGYMSKSKRRDERGRFDGWEYMVYAIPFINQSLVVVQTPRSEKRSVGGSKKAPFERGLRVVGSDS